MISVLRYIILVNLGSEPGPIYQEMVVAAALAQFFFGMLFTARATVGKPRKYVAASVVFLISSSVLAVVVGFWIAMVKAIVNSL